MNEENLKRLLRGRAQPEHGPGRQCPDDGEIAAYAERRLSGRDEARVEAHVADCDVCLERVAFLVHPSETDARAIAPDVLARARDIVPDRRAGWRAPAWRWAALAATAACVVLAVVLQWQAPRAPGVRESTERDGAVSAVPPQPAPSRSGAPGSAPGTAAGASLAVEAPAAKPAAAPGPAPTRTAPSARRAVVRTSPTGAQPLALRFPPEGATVPRPQLEFKWEGVPAAAYYEVHVVTEDGSVVWSGRVEGTHATPPGNAPLEPGRTYFAWIRAYLAGGGSLRSAAVSFRIDR